MIPIVCQNNDNPDKSPEWFGAMFTVITLRIEFTDLVVRRFSLWVKNCLTYSRNILLHESSNLMMMKQMIDVVKLSELAITVNKMDDKR